VSIRERLKRLRLRCITGLKKASCRGSMGFAMKLSPNQHNKCKILEKDKK